jgi:hypothetical protein
VAAPHKPSAADRLARMVLNGPGFIRRAAASQAKDPVEAWMLRQPDAVRESYVREVLEPALPPELRDRG